MIRELESENATLQEEYAHLKATTTSSSSSGGTTTSGVSVTTFASGALASSTAAADESSKTNDILTEAKLLRKHKERLESRMKVLEEHNQQLISQLGKLRQYICPKEGSSTLSGSSSEGLSTIANKTGTLNIKSVTASQLAQVIQWAFRKFPLVHSQDIYKAILETASCGIMTVLKFIMPRLGPFIYDVRKNFGFFYPPLVTVPLTHTISMR